MKTLYKDRLFLIKLRLITQILMKLIYIYIYIYIYNLSVFWKTERFQGKQVWGHNCDSRDFFFPQQFFLWLIFQPSWKCNYGSFLYFKHSTLFSAWVFFGFVVRNCKIFVQLSALFTKVSPDLKKFLIFESAWHFSQDLPQLPRIRGKTFVTFLKLSSLDIFFNVLETNFITGVNQNWLEDLERYFIFFC